MENIAARLEEILRKKNADWITTSELYEKMGASTRKILGLTNKKDVQKKLEPHLEGRLKFQTGSQSCYLVRALPEDELLFRLVQHRAERSPGKIGSNSPFKKDDFRDGLNRLLKAKRIFVGKLSGDKYTPIIYPIDVIACPAPPSTLIPVPAPPPPAPYSPPVSGVPVAQSSPYTQEAFHAAYKGLAQGRSFVRIYTLRRHLNWPRDAFDEMIRTLRGKRAIQMEVGDTENLTDQDIQDAFRDENGFLMLILLWR